MLKEKVNKMHEGNNKIRMECEIARHRSSGGKCKVKGKEKRKGAESSTVRNKMHESQNNM